ncbi:P-loop NTPase fold protein [Caulobacter sp. Root1472]|uniref:P-loop NTPase fold protein n=1 Tax=Caulobacter sp. Root1472 TaxID=1736470 RepID=UPI0006F7764B|nr:P-loop NTPase fold protein [Caulobacter sp. Root1472]KQZ33807.1 hypothetical protein ASD47_01670 [Caulobacter sp. Root1472]
MENTQAGVVEFLDYFCDERTKVDYALLINAPWGAGKTRFIGDYIKRHDDKNTRTDPLQPNTLFVSLFGLKTSGEVRDALFAAAHPYLSSGIAKFAGTLSSSLIDKYVGLKIDKDTFKAADIVKIDAKIIVFDDLERTAIPMGEALGLINSFIDADPSKGFKVIVIANEQAIKGEARAAYLDQKEKVIGRTLTVQADAATVFDEFASEMPTPAAKTAALSGREAALRVFQASGSPNFRSLRQALADFDRLVDKLDPRLAASPQALGKLLLFLVAVGVEMRRQGLSTEQVSGLDEHLNRFMLGPEEQPETYRVRTTIGAYADVDWRDPIVPTEVLADLIASGILDRNNADAHLSTHPLIVGPASSPSWRVMWDWRDLSPAEYHDVRNRVIEDLAAGAFKRPGEILHVAGLIIELALADDPLFPDVVTTFKRYVDEREAAGDLAPDIRQFEEPERDGFGSYGFRSISSEAFGEIWRYLRSATEYAQAEALRTAAGDFLASLNANEPVGDRLLRPVDLGGGCEGDAFLHNLDVGVFADAVLRRDKLDKSLLMALARRYTFAGTSGSLAPERDWVEALYAELRARATAAPAPLSTAWLQALAYYFEPVVDNFKRATVTG